MAYRRRAVKDYETVMNADLYNNLQDGIDEAKSSIGDIKEDTKGTVAQQLGNLEESIADMKLSYDEDSKRIVVGEDKPETASVSNLDIITRSEAAAIFDAAAKS